MHQTRFDHMKKQRHQKQGLDNSGKRLLMTMMMTRMMMTTTTMMLMMIMTALVIHLTIIFNAAVDVNYIGDNNDDAQKGLR